jgi:hypothetical protein
MCSEALPEDLHLCFNMGNHLKHRVRVKIMLYRRSVGQSVLLSSPHLGPKTRFLLPVDSWCGAPSLTRGRVSRLQFLLPRASAVILKSVSLYSLRFETPPTFRARSPYLYPPGTRWPSYTPKHWSPFSSPPTTRRATVEVFEPTSTRGLKHEVLETNIWKIVSYLTGNTAPTSYIGKSLFVVGLIRST